MSRDHVSVQRRVTVCTFFQGTSSWTKTPRVQRCRTTEEPQSCRVSTVTVSTLGRRAWTASAGRRLDVYRDSGHRSLTDPQTPAQGPGARGVLLQTCPNVLQATFRSRQVETFAALAPGPCSPRPHRSSRPGRCLDI